MSSALFLSSAKRRRASSVFFRSSSSCFMSFLIFSSYSSRSLSRRACHSESSTAATGARGGAGPPPRPLKSQAGGARYLGSSEVLERLTMSRAQSMKAVAFSEPATPLSPRPNFTSSRETELRHSFTASLVPCPTGGGAFMLARRLISFKDDKSHFGGGTHFNSFLDPFNAPTLLFAQPAKSPMLSSPSQRPRPSWRFPSSLAISSTHLTNCASAASDFGDGCGGGGGSSTGKGMLLISRRRSFKSALSAIDVANARCMSAISSCFVRSARAFKDAINILCNCADLSSLVWTGVVGATNGISRWTDRLPSLALNSAISAKRGSTCSLCQASNI
mmetsp:Transcript_20009/g.57320  ORF Transcript_20009/g.57320 Transcript_20009/m.57320 type:complete len:333 (-) Transcript_20009:624-1622(-)